MKGRVKVIELTAKNPAITVQEMADEMGLSIKGVEKAVRLLKQEGKLKRMGSARSGHWEVLENKAANG